MRRPARTPDLPILLCLLFVLLPGLAGASTGASGAKAEPGAVVLHGQTAFTFRAPRGELSPAIRARRAAESLRAVIAEGLEAELRVELHQDEAALFYGERSLFALAPADASLEGESSLQRFAESRRQALEPILRAELRRHRLQRIALALGLTVLLGLVTFLLMRQLRRSAARAQAWIESIEEPAAGRLGWLVASERTRSAAVITLHGAHFFAQATLAYLLLIGSFSLFEGARPWREQITAWASAPFLAVAEGISTGVPSLLLLFLLAVLVQAGWHAINYSFERIAAGKARAAIRLDLVAPLRLLLRLGLILLACLLLAPLLGGRVAEPLLWVGLAVALVIGLSLVPLLAGIAVGVFIILTGRLRTGDRLEVGGQVGTLASVDFSGLLLETAAGEKLLVPHLTLLVHPVRRLAPAVGLEVVLPVPAALPAAEALRRLEEAAQLFARAQGLAQPPRVGLESLHLRSYRIRISLPEAGEPLRPALLLALATALDERTARVPEPRSA